MCGAFFLAAMDAAQKEPNPWLILPFAVLLLSIALLPLWQRHWWETHYPKVAGGLGLVTVFYYGVILGDRATLGHTALEYVSFIALIGSLFIVAGGIHLTVKGEATPWANVLFLGIGAVLTNFIGTTGASMLLIRPWIRLNRYRITAFHIVFFIFVVSNCGGCLTPIGDPPLFIGYLKGIPFFWTLEHLWVPWLFVNTALVAIFHVLDRRNFQRVPAAVRGAETKEEEVWSCRGRRNFFYLAVILGGVFLPTPWRETIMIGAALASFFSTPKSVHAANDFNFGPIREVAWLFAGIFATMMPALGYLQVHAAGFGLRSTLAYYGLTGVLSSILDNAPTYLTFLTANLSIHGLNVNQPMEVAVEVARYPNDVLAISAGAVFFGALTYIGNGPNFMVKSIADQSGVPMPGFFGYTLRYAVPFLLPILVAAGLIFFR